MAKPPRMRPQVGTTAATCQQVRRRAVTLLKWGKPVTNIGILFYYFQQVDSFAWFI